MPSRIILKDGTEIENAIAARDSVLNRIVVHIPGKDIVNAALIFSDQNRTEEIICYFSIYKYTFTCYTNMYSIQYFENEDYVEIWLKPQEGITVKHKKELTVPSEYVPEEAVQLNQGE